MWTTIKIWWEIQTAVMHLQALSDRDLQDMGVTRETLHQAVRGKRAKVAEDPCRGGKREASLVT